MTSTRSRLPSRSACVALLAFVAFGCQSDGADGGDDGNDDASEAPSATEPALIRVRERDAVSANESSSPEADPSAERRNADDPEPPPANPIAADEELAAPPTPTFAACTSAGDIYSDCETIHVTAVQTSPERCIQLTIDNCGSYGRQGLSADTPFSWRLASGSVGSDADPCELGVFYPGTSSLNDATGSITWDETTADPTDLAFDLTLELPASAGQPQSIPLATPGPLQPTDCEQ